jgi:hypothetical protein
VAVQTVSVAVMGVGPQCIAHVVTVTVNPGGTVAGRSVPVGLWEHVSVIVYVLWARPVEQKAASTVVYVVT